MPNSYFTHLTVLKYTGIVNCILVMGIFVLTFLFFTALIFILGVNYYSVFVVDLKVSFFLGLIPALILMSSTLYTSCALRDLFG